MAYDHSVLMTLVHRDLLGGDAVFPSSVQLAVSIRQALDQDDVSIDEVTRLANAEPLLAVKLVRMANCVTFNPGGQPIYDVGQAISRVGFNVVRSVSLAIAIIQLKAVPLVAPFMALADEAWKRSVQVAALSRLLARKQRGVNADEAMLCGLVADIGVFYLLPKAGACPDYVANPAMLIDLLKAHGSAVGAQFLATMGLPGNIVQAVGQADLPDIHPANQLRQVLAEAGRMVALPQPWPEEDPQTDWLCSVQDQWCELIQTMQG